MGCAGIVKRMVKLWSLLANIRFVFNVTDKIKKYSAFDPLKDFFHLPILWWSIGFFVLVASVVTGLIIYNSELISSYDYMGFNRAISIFKVPLGILALIIPIVALFAANHRSVQTKRQITIADQQNIFSNYFKHIEEFEKYVSSHISDDLFNVNKRTTHKILFPNADIGNLQLAGKLLSEINELLNDTIDMIKQFKGGHKKKPEDTITNIEQNIRNVERLVGITYSGSKSGSPFTHNGVTIIVPNSSLNKYFKIIKERFVGIKAILEFDQQSLVPDSLLLLSKMNVEVVPSVILNSEINTSSFDPFDFRIG